MCECVFLLLLLLLRRLLSVNNFLFLFDVIMKIEYRISFFAAALLPLFPLLLFFSVRVFLSFRYHFVLHFKRHHHECIYRPCFFSFYKNENRDKSDAMTVDLT